MKFSITTKADWAYLRRFPALMVQVLKDALILAMNEARNHVYDVGFSGGPNHLNPRHRDAGLRGSIVFQVQHKAARLLGVLGSNLPYARIHELGGRTRPHTIEPKRAQALRFTNQQGQTVFARRVRHPGSRIPARPYLRPALEHAARKLDGFVAMGVRRHFREAAI